MSQNPNLSQLSDAGVSVWLDDLSRDLISSGGLSELVDTRSVVGVTTNPSIFQAALTSGTAYDEQVAQLASEGADVDAVIRTVTTDDVRNACDVLEPVYTATDTVDGRVSIEVDPRLAHDADATVEQAIDLWRVVDRPNLFIKIPATIAGLDAITRVLAEGISVNVTLIFSVERYRQVMEAYLGGLAAAAQAGHDLASIHSVASFFVSRVDTEVDPRLTEIGSDEAGRLQGDAQALRQAILDKGDPVDIARRARGLAALLVQAHPIPLVPDTLPHHARGAELYARLCASCHGPTGAGDGPAGAGLDPPPIDFTDRERADERSVFALYQVIEQGLEGTSMASYRGLPADDLWALATYSGALAYPEALVEAGRARLDGDPALRASFDLARFVGQTPADLAAVKIIRMNGG